MYRLGGDEFVVVCLNSEEAALTAQIAKARMYSNLKKVGMSLGYAYRNKSHEPFSNILREADRKMYMEKQENDLIDFVNILDIKRKCVIWHTEY